jgi:multiple sugar transport system ATP-binding protein
MNLIEVEVADGKLRTKDGLALPPPPGLPRDRRLIAGVRPEALEVTEPGAEGSVPARVISAEWLGDEIIYVVDHGGQQDVRVRMPPTVRFAADAPVGLRHIGGTPAVYDANTEELVA